MITPRSRKGQVNKRHGCRELENPGLLLQILHPSLLPGHKYCHSITCEMIPPPSQHLQTLLTHGIEGEVDSIVSTSDSHQAPLDAKSCKLGRSLYPQTHAQPSGETEGLYRCRHLEPRRTESTEQAWAHRISEFPGGLCPQAPLQTGPVLWLT